MKRVLRLFCLIAGLYACKNSSMEVSTTKKKDSLRTSAYHTSGYQKKTSFYVPVDSGSTSTEKQSSATKNISLKERVDVLEKQSKSITSARILFIEKNIKTYARFIDDHTNHLNSIEKTLAQLPIALTLTPDTQAVHVPLEQILKKIDEHQLMKRKKLEELIEENVIHRLSPKINENERMLIKKLESLFDENLTMKIHHLTHQSTQQKITEQNQAFYTGIVMPIDRRVQTLANAYEKHVAEHNRHATVVRKRCHNLKDMNKELATKHLKLQLNVEGLEKVSNNQYDKIVSLAKQVKLVNFEMQLIRQEIALLREEQTSVIKKQKNITKRKSF